MSVRALDVTDTADARRKMPIKVVGNPDRWHLLSKASSDDWMKSTKAMLVPEGCLVLVTTQQRNPDGSYAVAEALAYVPGPIAIGHEADGGAALVVPGEDPAP